MMRISTAIFVLAAAWSGAATADNARCDTQNMAGRWLFDPITNHWLVPVFKILG